MCPNWSRNDTIFFSNSVLYPLFNIYVIYPFNLQHSSGVLHFKSFHHLPVWMTYCSHFTPAKCYTPYKISLLAKSFSSHSHSALNIFFTSVTTTHFATQIINFIYYIYCIIRIPSTSPDFLRLHSITLILLLHHISSFQNTVHTVQLLFQVLCSIYQNYNVISKLHCFCFFSPNFSSFSRFSLLCWKCVMKSKF